MGKGIVAVDVDGTVADLLSEWLRLYNRDYNDKLTPSDITDWYTDQFVKPECGQKIYEYLAHPELYKNVIPYPDAITGVRGIRELGYRVVFPTSCVEGSWGNKYTWLKRWGFIETTKDYMEVSDKSLVRADWLIDDYWGNLRVFRGIKILFVQTWNHEHWYDPDFVMLKEWGDIFSIRCPLI